MQDLNFEDYVDLSGSGIGQPRKEVSPEDEFFHSVYICGRDRENHRQIVEQNGKLQIRGVDYNKDEVHMIITHVKKVRINSKFDLTQQRTVISCGSKLNTNPWVGTSGRNCASRKDRVNIPECAECKHNIVVFGVLCDNKEGRIKIGADGKPVFCFFVGKGIKWEDVNTHLTTLAEQEITPIFTLVTDKSIKWEKENLDFSKRVVTVIKVSYKRSRFNNNLLQTFSFDTGAKLTTQQIVSLIEVAKKINPKVDEKLDRLIGSKLTDQSEVKVNEQTMSQTSIPQPTMDIPSMANQTKVNDVKPKDEVAAPITDAPVESYSFDNISW